MDSALPLTCSGCGATIDSGTETVVPPRKRSDPAITLCPDCVAAVEQHYAAETEGARMVPAIALGLLASLAAAAVWYGAVILTKYQLGVIAVGVGWLVAYAVMFGAGKKRGGALPYVSVGISLIGMVIAQYLIVQHYAVKALADEGITGVRLLPVGLSINLIYESLKADPLTLLFWIIALWQAFVLTRKRRIRK